MAIKIPSKHIYSMDNPKIRDNFIDNVEVNMTVVAPNNEFETPVHNEKLTNFETEDVKSGKSNFEDINRNSNLGSTNNTVVKFVSYVGIDLFKLLRNIKIEFLRLKNNSYIDKVFTYQDENGNADIKYSIFGTKNTGTVTGVMNYNYAENEFSMQNLVYNQENIENAVFDIPKSISFDYNGKFEIFDMEQTVTSTMEVKANDNISNPSVLITDDKVLIELYLYCGYRVAKIGTQFAVVGSSNYSVSGTYEEYIPNQIEITIYGNTIGISLEDGTVTYGSGTKPFSLDGNELLQDSATTNGKLTTQHLADNILAQYQNGKETATLLCDIGEYYEENGTKAIGIEMQDRMSFHEHDLVIPYVFGADGKDRPMSRYSNGEPKVFEVVAVKRFFDGAVWQELSLLEFTKTT